MEVPAEEGWGGRETGALYFRVLWGFALAGDPVEEGIDVELVVSDRCVYCVCYRLDLGKVTDCETLAGRTTDDVVSRVFICVGGLLAACFNNFPYCVYAEAHVWVDLLTFAVDNRLGEIVWVNAAREELGGVVV